MIAGNPVTRTASICFASVCLAGICFLARFSSLSCLADHTF